MELGVRQAVPVGQQQAFGGGGFGGQGTQAFGGGGFGGQGTQAYPANFGNQSSSQARLPRTPEEASGQQELIIVGSLNGWSVRAAKQQPLGLRLLPDGIWQHECRVQLNTSGEMEFQVLSKASAWEWCLYPEDADSATLVAGDPSAVKVGLSVLDGAHDRNFRICERGKATVAIKVRVCSRDFLVWYDKEHAGPGPGPGGGWPSPAGGQVVSPAAAITFAKQLAEARQIAEAVSSGMPMAKEGQQLGESPQEPTAPTWRVAGGADKGGIAVRSGASFESETLSRRLSTGALVREEERRNERIHYERLSGSGPHRGWVSVRIPGKELLQEVGACPNPYFVIEAPEVKKKNKKKKADAVPPPPPADDEHVEWMGGRSVFLRAPRQTDSNAKQAEPPAESVFWSNLEHQLFVQSQGQYVPKTMAKARREAPRNSGAQRLKEGHHCRVTVVTPTTESRAEYHERLWACFQAQTWPDKELVVVDTAWEPSAFFRRQAESHEELIYLCTQQNFSIGLKRNMAVHLASGDVLANFDDDDIYAPTYIEVMVGRLEEQRLAALTLSAWFDYHVRSGRCGFVDPAEMHDLDLLMQKDEEGTGANAKEMNILRDEVVEQAVFGYGFSYVHRRGPALSNPYPDSWFGEDLAFMRQLRWALGRHSVGLLRDEQGICLHMMHGANTADSVAHRAVTAKELKGLDVFKLKFNFTSPPRGPAPRGGEHVGKFFSSDLKARRQRFPEASRPPLAAEAAEAEET